MEVNKSFVSWKGDIFAKTSSGNFEITMGSYHGAECTDLVGNYIMNCISDLNLPVKVGLYRDDMIGYSCARSLRIVEDCRKKIFRCFKELGLTIVFTPPSRIITFLDIVFDFQKRTFGVNPKDEIIYVNSDSDHPLRTIKGIPSMVNSRLLRLSSCEKEYDRVKPIFSNALNSCGYSTGFNYVKSDNSIIKKKRIRQRNVTWWNPPFSSNADGVARKAFSIIDEYLFKNNFLSRIFNKNSVKISYKTLPGAALSGVIASHNRRVLNVNVDTPARSCNCRRAKLCPVGGFCLKENMIYRVDVTAGLEKRHYDGMCSRPFKARFNEHRSSCFKKMKEGDKCSTTLASYVRRCLKNGIKVDMKWKLLASAKSFDGESCRLCDLEKFVLFYNDRGKFKGGSGLSLNKKDELFHGCVHTKKFRFDRDD